MNEFGGCDTFDVHRGGHRKFELGELLGDDSATNESVEVPASFVRGECGGTPWGVEDDFVLMLETTKGCGDNGCFFELFGFRCGWLGHDLVW